MVYIKLRCRIRILRKNRDLTQEELSEALGISRQSLISLEFGKSVPSLSLALKFSQLFELPIERIWENRHFDLPKNRKQAIKKNKVKPKK